MTWHLSTEPRADGTIAVRLYRFVPGAKASDSDAHERVEYVISHDDAWHLLANLTGQLRSQSDERVRNTAAGDCATCGNFRLIEVPAKHGPEGRTERVYCPDCHDRYAAATPAYPSWPEPDENPPKG